MEVFQAGDRVTVLSRPNVREVIKKIWPSPKGDKIELVGHNEFYSPSELKKVS